MYYYFSKIVDMTFDEDSDVSEIGNNAVEAAILSAVMDTSAASIKTYAFATQEASSTLCPENVKSPSSISPAYLPK